MGHHDEIGQLMVEEGGGSYTAKSVILDCADNHGSASYIGIRAIDFWFNGSKITVDAASGSAGATSVLAVGTYDAELSFYTAEDKAGTAANEQWLSATNAPQRLYFTFNTPITFDSIVINNGHNGGGTLTDVGANNVKIQTTEDTGAISSVYNAAVTGGVTIYDGVFREHDSGDGEDPEILTLI